MKLFVDQRWHGDHGIGRFSRGVTRRITSPHTVVSGDHRSLFSMVDPIRLDVLLRKRDTFYYTPGYNGPLVGTARSAITVHDLMHVKFDQYQNLKNKIYYNSVVKRCVRAAPVVFTVSEFTRQEIAAWADVKEEKIVVVSNGVESRYKPNQGSESSVPYFLYVGNHKPHKNIHRLLHAYARSQARKNAWLFISGNATKEEEAIISEERIGKTVKYLGFVEEKDLPGLYAGALALVLPSLYEGFGLPPLEAMACGTAVAVSNNTSMPEVVGNAGLLFDPYEIDEMSATLDRLEMDAALRGRLGEAGRLRAAAYTWDNAARRLDLTLQSFVGS
jgi:glycosyltransferase involved in cell wall biosynthesis